jgi:hypothetical protein
VINAPKLKTHKKAGITCALKNMVGINGDKSWLPHHRAGAPPQGGDEYPKMSFVKSFESTAIDCLRRNPMFWCAVRKIYHAVKKEDSSCRVTYDTREGSWYGNDTIWRTILDLNTILFYSDKNGVLKDSVQRKYFVVVDGILAGEGDGPIRSTPKKAGLIVSGLNPVNVDYACAKIMGFNPDKIKQIKKAAENKKHMLTNGESTQDIKSNVSELPSLNFAPPSGWAGYLEI